ncbi:unnamed protein product [Sphagnum balticum]
MQPSLDARAIDNWSSLCDVEICDDFVGLRSERELEQLRVLGALVFHTGTFMLLAPDVDTKKALHCRNHAAYGSLHRLKTVFHSVFVLKRCLSTHDDMQGANKMCSIKKSRINRPIGKRARTHTQRD